MQKINRETIKYWHTVTIKDGQAMGYEIPTLDGVALVEIRRHDDNKTYIYHVPADEIDNCETALNQLFEG